MPTPPSPPAPTPLEASWARTHGALHGRVREALLALPFHFRTETVIAGINATDIFNLNAALGAAIEDQVVTSLNAMRGVWDPDDEYTLYGFVRQAQTFPDVLLRRLDAPGDREGVLMGIELKGWYLLSKEAEPSFRYAVTPAACAPQDLLVVVPWALSNVIGGSPRAFTPYVEQARHAATFRNYHWTHLRTAKGATGIVSPEGVTPYPRKADLIADNAENDRGRNFGRFARTGLMDGFIAATLRQPLSGIEAQHWLSFFRAFQDHAAEADVQAALDRLSARAEANTHNEHAVRLAALAEALRGLLPDLP